MCLGKAANFLLAVPEQFLPHGVRNHAALAHRGYSTFPAAGAQGGCVQDRENVFRRLRDTGIPIKQAEEQEMDPRIRDVQIQGNTLIAAIDGIPVTIVLPPKVVDAYEQGALPIGTLANAVLAKCDQMQDMTQARDRFEEESREVGRGLSQR